MTAIGNWRFLRAGPGPLSRFHCEPAVPDVESATPNPAVSTGRSCDDALRDALAMLRRHPPMAFSDSPDHDFVALADRYSSGFRPLLRGESAGSEDLGLWQALRSAERTYEQHAAWSHDWRRRAILGDAWILDGASVRYRFVHDRLLQSLRPLAECESSTAVASLALSIAERTAELSAAALDLCRDHEVREHAMWLQSMTAVAACGFRDLLSETAPRL